MQRRPSVVWPLARTPHHESGRELVPGTDYPKASGSRRLDHRPHLGASSLPGPGWCSPAWPAYWQNPHRLCAPARAEVFPHLANPSGRARPGVPAPKPERISPKASGSRRLANPAALFLRFTQVLQPGKIPIERKKILRFFQLSV